MNLHCTYKTPLDSESIEETQLWKHVWTLFQHTEQDLEYVCLKSRKLNAKYGVDRLLVATAILIFVKDYEVGFKGAYKLIKAGLKNDNSNGYLQAVKDHGFHLLMCGFDSSESNLILIRMCMYPCLSHAIIDRIHKRVREVIDGRPTGLIPIERI